MKVQKLKLESTQYGLMLLTASQDHFHWYYTVKIGRKNPLKKIFEQ